MKYLFMILLIGLSLAAKSQAVVMISPTVTVDSLHKLPTTNTYRFYTIAKKDTVDLQINKSFTCPVCPVCPPPPKQRTWKGMSINTRTGQVIITYDDQSSTTTTLQNTIFIQ